MKQKRKRLTEFLQRFPRTIPEKGISFAKRSQSDVNQPLANVLSDRLMSNYELIKMKRSRLILDQ